MNVTNLPDKLISVLNEYSPKWFVNHNNELIIEPKNNIYFLLEDIKTDLDLKCKIIAWLSRPAHKGISVYWQVRIRGIFNEYLDKEFSKDEIEQIYCYLGNDCNRPKCIKFIESDYDFNVLTA